MQGVWGNKLAPRPILPTTLSLHKKPEPERGNKLVRRARMLRFDLTTLQQRQDLAL